MKYLPTPTSAGAYNNYLAQPVSDGILSNTDEFLYKIDHYWGEKDHFFATVLRQTTQPNQQCALPVQLCTSSPANPEDAWVSRFNWDHIFSPTLLSHFAYGYLNRNEGYGSVTGQNPNDLPKIPNAVANNASPLHGFGGSGINTFTSWGNTEGPGYLNKTTRPSHIANELVTWVHGAHTIKFGGEFRHLQQVFRGANNESGWLNLRLLPRFIRHREWRSLREFYHWRSGQWQRQCAQRIEIWSGTTRLFSARRRYLESFVQSDTQLRSTLGQIFTLL